MSENNFQAHLEIARILFDGKLDTMEAYITNVIDICKRALVSGNVRHPPITHRIKEWESAAGTLRRRQQERIARQRLKAVVESKGWNWADWCRVLGQEQYQQEIGPFQDPQEMLDALHDFGGLRISLYFPGDVERVADLLSNRLQVISKSRKDQTSDTAQKLEKCIDILDRPGAIMYTDAGKAADLVKGIFPGYIATHLIVKLTPEDIPTIKISAWKDIKVEIQLGTLIMHVWSEIEHDMLYKPLAAQDSKISREEEQVLDIINGIVITGEGALRQLETCMERRQYQRTKDKATFATSHHELSVWIEKYCAEIGKPLISDNWNRLPQLYEILKATGNHQQSKVESILEGFLHERDASRDTIPLHMLELLCARASITDHPSLDLNGIGMLGPNAQFWATHFVHSLNMAIYLDVEFSPVINRVRPSITKMLDILHPYNPLSGDAEEVQIIISYCYESLSRQCDPWAIVSARLSRTTGVIRTMNLGDPHAILVPGILSRFLGSESRPEDPNLKNVYVQRTQRYWIIGIVSYYLDRKSSTPSHDVWDQIKSLSSGSENPIKQQFFKPLEDPGLKPWELIDAPASAIILRISRSTAVVPPTLRKVDNAEGILSLLDRLQDRND
ncbi:hypothetical protein NHQ30_009783 [Ciborinia camelliae]|nr:hypothetical protein NHQ30_009783 [Ciborinia camelliae]